MTVPHPSRLAGLKDYLSHREVRFSLPSRWAATPGEDSHTQAHNAIQSWSHWASKKIRRNTPDAATVEEVHLFPGWATKRPRRSSPGEPESTFDVVFHVSGFAASRRTPELLTRSQRAFLKLARGFASIPKTQPILQSIDAEAQDFPQQLRLPPRPDEISDDYDVETLDAHFRNSGNNDQGMDDTNFTPPLIPADRIPAELARLHENLESRLRLFWASSLSSRKVQVSVFLQIPDQKHHRPLREFRPLLVQELLTGADGHFSGIFRIHWNDIQTHPAGIHITSSQPHVEHALLVEARIVDMERTLEPHETPTSTVYIPITHSVVRVISDIDDTVKVSRVVDGARAIFNQVFVKDLETVIIPEMGEWYGTMWKRGVRFHYVSNSPCELLPVINQFITLANLPTGSIRLRSYAGRSFFNDLLSASATRKKGNVVELLDQFPESHFVLIGDSGEQDLELYSSLAAERPGQIAGIFIRDVCALGLEDPTGTKVDFGSTNSPMRVRSKGTLPFPSNIPSRIVPKRASSDTDVSSAYPGAIHISRPSKKGSLPPISFSLESSPEHKPLSRVSEDSSSSVASGSSMSSSLRSTYHGRPITEGERKRWDLQSRVNKARLVIPSHIVLRVFEDPKECVEAEHIIQQLMDVRSL